MTTALVKGTWTMDTSNLIYYTEAEKIDLGCGFRYNYFLKLDNELTLHHHEYYEIFYLPYEGCAHLANGKLQQLPKGSLVFIRPDDCHDFCNPELKPITIVHLAVQREIIEKLFDFLSDAFPSQYLLKAPMPPYVVLDSFQMSELSSMLDKLNSIDYEDKRAKTITIRVTLARIFSQYFSDDKSLSPEQQLIPEWLSSTCNKMKQLENFSIGLSRMVELSGHTKEHLCRSFKKYYGSTAMDYINELRLTYIANMLIYTNNDIIDICYDSGYTNLSWMYTLFKKKYGLSPSKFRKVKA